MLLEAGWLYYTISSFIMHAQLHSFNPFIESFFKYCSLLRNYINSVTASQNDSEWFWSTRFSLIKSNNQKWHGARSGKWGGCGIIVLCLPIQDNWSHLYEHVTFAYCDELYYYECHRTIFDIWFDRWEATKNGCIMIVINCLSSSYMMTKNRTIWLKDNGKLRSWRKLTASNDSRCRICSCYSRSVWWLSTNLLMIKPWLVTKCYITWTPCSLHIRTLSLTVENHSNP